MDFGNTSMTTASSGQEASAPAFLFGPKRRSMVVGNSVYGNGPFTPTAPTSDIFASPASALPSHLRDASAPGSAGKSVHWSPSLIQQDRDRTPAFAPPGSASSVAKAPPSVFSSPAVNAPPLRSLRDDLEPAKKASRRSLVPMTPNRGLSTPSASVLNDSMCTANESVDESAFAETWVTIFGFSNNQLPAVLKLFSRHGEIVSHQTPAKGNWMHVRYSCVTHAQQALARNGSLLDASTFIGAIPCIDKDVTSGKAVGIVARTPVNIVNRSLLQESILEGEEEEEIIPTTTPARGIETSQNENRNVNDSLLNSSNYDQNASFNTSRMSNRSGIGMRSLCLETNGVKTVAAQKQDGIMNKFWSTMGYNA